MRWKIIMNHDLYITRIDSKEYYLTPFVEHIKKLAGYNREY
jgi:hypothetical protein